MSENTREEIKALRARIGMSQTELAKAFNIPLRTLKSWEAGEQSVNHRRAPSYVLNMLAQLVNQYEAKSKQ